MQKVLVVDSTKAFLELAQPIFSRGNVAVYTAASGQEAIEAHKKERVNLILLDRYMPGMTGEDVCKIIRGSDSTKNVAIIMLMTALKAEKIEEYINSIGADDYLAKPFNPSDLINKVSRFINLPVRQNIRILTKLTVNAKTGAESFMGNTLNISVGGMLLETEKQIEVGSSVKCTFSIPDAAAPITVTGNMVRKMDGRNPILKVYGIKFADLDTKSEITLEKYIFKQQRQHLRERVM